jgi:hypothetical protein
MRCTTLILVLLAFTGAAFAQNQSRNAATWYRKAIEQYQNLSDSQRDLFASYDPAQGPPSPELRAALSQVQSIIQNFQRGASQEMSDFALDKSQGIDLLLPHLSPMRGIAKLTRADIMVRLHDGDASGAAERLASLYQAGGHGGDDGTLISSLVGQAIFNVADQAAQSGLDSAAFNAADSAKLLGAMKQLGVNDPFNYVEGVAGEQEYFVDWIADKFAGEDGPAKFAEMMGQWGENERMQQVAALDAEQFQQSLDQHDAMLNSAIEIFSMTDPEKAKAEMAKLAGEIERGEHGILALTLAPSLTRILEQKLKGEQQVASRLELFSKLAAGEANPDDVANAALWYLRAIELLDKIDPVKLQALRDAIARPDAPLNADVLQSLNGAQQAIDVFREASLKRRCDFGFVRQREQSSLIIPSYAPGMHDGLRIIRLDALRLRAAGDDDLAAERLAICWRMCGHLGDEPPLTHPAPPTTLACSIIAHRNFNDTLPMVESWVKHQRLAEESLIMLRESLARIGRKDPFGYISSTMETRKQVVGELHGQYINNQEQMEAHRKTTELVEQFDVDRMFHTLVIFDQLHAAAPVEPLPGELATNAVARPDANRLSDLLDLTALENIRTRVHELAPALAQHDWTEIAEIQYPAMFAGATISDHMRRARGDLRQAHLLLRNDEAKPMNEPPCKNES